MIGVRATLKILAFRGFAGTFSKMARLYPPDAKLSLGSRSAVRL